MKELVALENLSAKQEKFCLEYAQTGNAAESYIRAGYNARKGNSANVNAHRLLEKPQIQRRLQELAAELKQSKIADIEECQAILTEILRSPKSKYMAKIKAAQTLMKAQGAFTTQVNLNAAIPVVISGGDDLED